jgi:hypothetical protein
MTTLGSVVELFKCGAEHIGAGWAKFAAAHDASKLLTAPEREGELIADLPDSQGDFASSAGASSSKISTLTRR